jgi:quinolinate synthase
MERNTFEGVYAALRDLKPLIHVEPDVAAAARQALSRMMQLAES